MSEVAPIPFGQYDTNTNWSSFVGWTGTVPDLDFTGATTPVRNGAMTTRVILVQNLSGSTIAAGSALKFTAGNWMKGVTLATNGGPIRCYAPGWINGSQGNTIPNNAYFLAVYNGPATVLTDGSGLSENDVLIVGSSSGAVKTSNATNGANTNLRGGTAMAAAAAQGTGPVVYVRAMVKTDLF